MSLPPRPSAAPGFGAPPPPAPGLPQHASFPSGVPPPGPPPAGPPLLGMPPLLGTGVGSGATGLGAVPGLGALPPGLAGGLPGLPAGFPFPNLSGLLAARPPPPAAPAKPASAPSKAANVQPHILTMSGFPSDWAVDAIPSKIQSELSQYGPLVSPPKVIEAGKKAVCTFKDADHAKAAAARTGGSFKIELRMMAAEKARQPVFTARSADSAPPKASSQSGGGSAPLADKPVTAPAAQTSAPAAEKPAAREAAAPKATTRDSDSRADRRTRDAGRTLFVGNIPFEASETDMKCLFGVMGVPVEFRMVSDKDTKQPKGYGFIDFVNRESAEEALKFFADLEYRGRSLRVSRADNALQAVSAGELEISTAHHGRDVLLKGLPDYYSAPDTRSFVRSSLSSELRGRVIGIVRLPRKETEKEKLNTDGEAKNENGEEGEKPKNPEDGKDDGTCVSVIFATAEDAQAAANRLAGRKVVGNFVRVFLAGEEIQTREQKEEVAASKAEASATLHIDELAMPKRPKVEPSSHDREVWIDPLPDDADLEKFLGSFGPTEEVFRIPDVETGQPGDRGYVKFKEHAGAEACVSSGSGSWSESERALSSQQQTRSSGRECAYPESFIGMLLGHRGERITSAKDEIGAIQLSMRGEGLGEGSESSVSARLHFTCKGSFEAIARVQTALEQLVSQAHEGMAGRIANGPSANHKRKQSEARAPSRDRRRRRDRDRDGDRRPPGDPQHPPPPGWPWPPPPGMHPWGPPPGYPPPPWMGYHPHMPPPPGGAAHMPPPPGMWGPGPPPPGAPPGMGPPPSGVPPPAGSPPPGGAAIGDGSAATPSIADAARSKSRSRRGRRRREEDGAEEGGAHKHRRRRRRKEGGAEESAGSESNQEELALDQDHNAGGAKGSGDAFLDNLPAQLTPAEADLRSAVVAFLEVWEACHPDGECPNLVHLGGDTQVRRTKAEALPPEVNLKAWIKARLAPEVDVDGQKVKALSQR